VHEFSIVQALLDQVTESISEAGQSGRVVRLDLIVGRLSGVHVDSLRFAFDLLAPESVAEGAQLGIEQKPAAFRCGRCQATGDVVELIADCPRCAAPEITIVGGQELVLQSIELEQEE